MNKLRHTLMIGILTAILVILSLGVTAMAEDRSGTIGKNGGLTWTIHDRTLTISGSDTMEDFPGYWRSDSYDTIDYVETPWAEGGTVSETNAIKKVVVKSGVQNVGSFAFADLPYLDTVVLEEGVTYIGEGAFAADSRIGSLSLPSSLKTIGDNAFKYSVSHEAKMVLTLPEGLTSIGAQAFDSSHIYSVCVPGTVTDMGYGAFMDCASLETVVFSNGLVNIGASDFAYCSKIASVSLPSSIRTVGTEAFFCCSGLTELDLGTGVRSISTDAFHGCSQLQSLHIPASLRLLGSQAFAYCSKLSKVTISEGLVTVGSGIFSFTDVEELLYPNSTANMVVDLGTSFFGTMHKLKKVRLPADREYGLKEKDITISDGSTYEKYNALGLFGGAEKLEEVIVPNGVEIIGMYALSDLPSGVKLTLPDSVKVLWEYCLPKDVSLTKLPAKLEYLGAELFYENKNITAVTLPSSLKYIDRSCFRKSGLQQLTLPQSLVKICYGAFFQCDDLKTVTFPQVWSGEMEDAFSYNTKLTYFNYPKGTSWAFQRFEGCTNLTTVYIPQSASQITDLTESCVTDIYYAGSDVEWFNRRFNESITVNTYGTSIRVHFNSTPLESKHRYQASPVTGYYVSVTRRSFTILDMDAVGTTQPTGFLITYCSGSVSTGDSNSADIKLTDRELAQGITVTKEGYFDCTLDGSCLSSANVIRMYRKSTTNTPFVQNAVIRTGSGTAGVDVIGRSLTLCKETRMEGETPDRTFDLYLNVNMNGYTPELFTIHQVRDNINVEYPLTNNANNEQIPWEQLFTTCEPVYIRIHTEEGCMFTQKLNLTILPYERLDINLKMDISDSVTLPDDQHTNFPEFAKWTMEIDMKDVSGLPVKFQIKEDGTVIGVVGIEMVDKDKIETLYSEIGGVNIVSTRALKEILQDNKVSPLQYARTCVASGKVKFVGTFTGKVDSQGSLELSEIDIKLLFTGSLSHLNVIPIGGTPIYVKTTLEAAFAAAMKFLSAKAQEEPEEGTYPKNSYELGEGIGLTFTVTLTPEIGIGVPEFMTAGIKTPNELKVLWTTGDVGKGPEYWYSTELDLNLQLLIFKGDIPIIEKKEILLYKDGKWICKTKEEMIKEGIPFENALIEDAAAVRTLMNTYSDSSDDLPAFNGAYYFNASPQIAQLEEGKLLAVWLGENGAEYGVNRSILQYSIYENGFWSEPEYIYDYEQDGCVANLDPCLYAQDGKAYLVWTRADRVMDGSYDTLEEAFSVMNIAYATFEDGQWSDISTVTDARDADLAPTVTVVNGTPTVAWYHGSYYGQEQTVMTASLIGGSWNITPLQENVSYIDSLAILPEGESFTVAYSCGDDPSLYGHSVYACGSDTQAVLLADNAASVQSDGSRFWWIDHEIGAVCSSTGDAVTCGGYVSSFTAADNGVFLLTSGEEGKVKIAASYRNADDVMGETVTVKQVDSSLMSVCAAACGDRYALMDARPYTGFGCVQSKLYFALTGPGVNLTVDSVSYDPYGLAEGEDLQVMANITNNGTEKADYCRITLEDQYGGELAWEFAKIDLNSGDSTCVYITLPDYDYQDNVTVKVEPMKPETQSEMFASLSEMTDADISDNTGILKIRCYDISIEDVITQVYNASGVDMVHISAMAVGRGLYSDGIIGARLYDEKHNLLAETSRWDNGEEMSYVMAGEGEMLSFDVPLSQIGEGGMVYVEAVIEEYQADCENILTNNTGMSIVRSPAPEAIEASYASYITHNGDGTATVTFTVHNGGDSVLKALLCASGYESDGRQYAVVLSDAVTVEAGKTERREIVISVPEGGTVKYFLFNADTMTIIEP